ncbi:MAG: DUF4136 domain-containing protein [Candidatus Krumholzibacteria bacterium]|nr:DUF4136 domain-containing protein [Candidatus Krumholzibacteria bacterium]
MYCARNLFSGLLVLVLLASIAGCSSLTVNYDYDQNVEWTKFKTYGWMETPDRPSDPNSPLQDTPLLQQRVHNSVEFEMQERGITMSDNPDLLVVYHIGTQEQIQVTDWGYRYSDYYWGYGGRQIDVYQFTEGSLVIDLIDAETQNLIWRGTGTGVVDESQKSPEEMQDQANQVINKIMKSFPPN